LLASAPELMKDGDFVLKTASIIVKDWMVTTEERPGLGPWTGRLTFPQYKQEIPKMTARRSYPFFPVTPPAILDYAPELCKDGAFLLKAKEIPQLYAIHYADERLRGSKKFMLEMIKGYEMPMTYSFYAITGHSWTPASWYHPCVDFATDQLKRDEEFVKQAALLYPDAWKYVPNEMHSIIFTSKEICTKHYHNQEFREQLTKFYLLRGTS